MKWLTNIYNPEKKDAKQRIFRGMWETTDEAWARQVAWLKGKHIGRPQGTEHYTAEQLEADGLVGVYADEETD